MSAVCTTHNNGYSYSDALDGRWMLELINSGIVSNVPTAPGNNCDSYYRYLRPNSTGCNCPARTQEYALLEVFGVEGGASMRPSNAATTYWKPCPDATASWGSPNPEAWTFILE